MKLDLLSSFLPNQSVKQGQAGLINWYIEKASGVATDSVVAYPTPGMLSFLNIPGQQVRPGSMAVARNLLFVCVDNNIYKVDSTPSYTKIGSVNTVSGNMQVAEMPDYIIWVDGVNGYVYQLSTETFQEITDPNFPNGATTLDFLDGYLVANITTSPTGVGLWRYSNATTPLVWQALNTGETSAQADTLMRILSDRAELYFFGSRHIEVWYDAGAQLGTTFTFAREDAKTIPYGCAATNSVVKGKYASYFLASSERTKATVCQLQNYQIAEIAPPPVVHEIDSYSTISDAIGFIYENDGHEFYVLTFPTMLQTWVYDISMQVWHKRQSYLPTLDSVNIYNRYRPNAYAFFNGYHVVGDVVSGNLYYLDDATYTELGQIIPRTMTSNPIFHDSRNITIGNIEIEMEPGVGLTSGQGSDPQIFMRLSRDGGFTWGNWMSRTIGKIGQYTQRIIFGRLGVSRHWVVQLQVTDPVKAAILHFRADLDVEDIGAGRPPYFNPSGAIQPNG